MIGTGGPTHGPRDGLVLVVLLENSTVSFVHLNSVVCRTPSSGLLNILHWTENRFVGAESTVLQDGTLNSYSGKQLQCASTAMKLSDFYFASLSCRCAFGTYILSILLFIFVIRLGAWFMLLTGLLMVLACFAFGIIIINDPPVAIPFANEIQGTVRVTPTFGWSFILTLVTGVALVILGVVILLLDYFFPRQIATVFHHSTVEEDEFFQVRLELSRPKVKGFHTEMVVYIHLG